MHIGYSAKQMWAYIYSTMYVGLVCDDLKRHYFSSVVLQTYDRISGFLCSAFRTFPRCHRDVCRSCEYILKTGRASHFILRDADGGLVGVCCSSGEETIRDRYRARSIESDREAEEEATILRRLTSYAAATESQSMKRICSSSSSRKDGAMGDDRHLSNRLLPFS